MPLIAYPGITDKQVAAKYRDGVATDASLRTLGTGATQAAAGTAPAATLVTAEAYTDAGVTAAEAFATAADSTVLASAKTYADTGDALLTPLTRTLSAGTGLTGGGSLAADRTFTVAYGATATTSCVGDDGRLSDTRTPTDGTVTTAKIVDANVTYAKIQNISATDKILGRKTAGAGVAEEIDFTPVARTLSAQTTQALMRTTGLGTTTVGDAVAIAATAAAARTAIGAVIGTDVQAQNANLTALAGLTLASATIPVATGAGAMALDDWDRTSGTWTPILKGETTAGTNAYTFQVGRYIRRGKMVYIEGRLLISAKSVAMVGRIQIGGLPFTTVNNANQFGALVVSDVEQVAFSGFLSGLTEVNSTVITLQKNTTGTANVYGSLATADFGTASGFKFNMWYEAA